MKKVSIIMSMLLVAAMLLMGCGGGEGQTEQTEQTTAAGGDTTTEAAPSGDVIVAKLGHVVAEDSAYHYGATVFAQLVEEKSNGTIKIEIYPNSQLGGDRDLLEGLSMNSVQFSLPGGLTLAQYDESIGVFSLPFLYETREDAHKALDSDYADEIFSRTLPHGFRVLGCIEKGFNQLATRNIPINGLADVKGMKIRVPDAPLYMSTWQLLGAAPSPMAWSEVFSALQTGVVDGEEAPLSSFAANGFGEVAKHFAYINYLYDPVCITVSEPFYQSLTAEQQAILDEAADEAKAIQREWVQGDDQKKEEDLKTNFGVTFYNPPLAEFQEAVKPLYDEFVDQEALAKVLELLGR